VRTIFDHIKANWSAYAIPIIVFLVSIIALFWLRRLALTKLEKWTENHKWPKENFLIKSVRGPSSLLCITLSLYLGLSVSSIHPTWKSTSGNVLWTLFIIALTISLLHLISSFIFYYGAKLKMPKNALLASRNILRTALLIVVLLIILDIWGVPISPLLLFIAVAVLVAALAFRDAVPNIFASFQIAATQEVKAGDYIKLDSQEEGYVEEISWNNTRLKALDGSLILIPNNILLRRKIINYGRPLKKASQPFHFNTRAHLAELTGLRAKNLKELTAILKQSPDPVIYYHTHHYIELHQYLVPEITNDFANWVKNSLDNHVLGERLANVSVIEFNDLSAFRDKLVNLIETYLAQDSSQRDALSGREFYFMKSVDVILPTTYTAHDLREFVEALRKIAPSSIYFHIFESRLRLKTATNDFAVWLANDMDEKELSQEIAGIDPYTYTLEGLRSLLIQIIEKHIK
jgi:small-conductance mechanosensitive channel